LERINISNIIPAKRIEKSFNLIRTAYFTNAFQTKKKQCKYNISNFSLVLLEAFKACAEKLITLAKEVLCF